MEFSLRAIPLPLHLRPETPMTDDELLRFCARNEGLRVEREINGEVLVMSPAGFGTGSKNGYLIYALGAWSEADGRGIFADSNTGFSLPDGSMRSPDAAWISSSRVAAIPKAEQEQYPHLCPDFIVELRSPSDSLPGLQAKMEQWIANGAQLAWLIDPQSKAVTIYQPGHQPSLFEAPDFVEGTGPVAGFRLNLARIWE